MIWKVRGSGLDAIRVRADSLDEALKIARTLNPNYNTTQPEEGREWQMRSEEVRI